MTLPLQAPKPLRHEGGPELKTGPSPLLLIKLRGDLRGLLRPHLLTFLPQHCSPQLCNTSPRKLLENTESSSLEEAFQSLEGKGLCSRLGFSIPTHPLEKGQEKRGGHLPSGKMPPLGPRRGLQDIFPRQRHLAQSSSEVKYQGCKLSLALRKQ